MNLPIGIFFFITASAITYGLWNHMNTLLSYFAAESTELYIFLATSWIIIIFTVVFILPMKMMISDDTGGG